MRVRWRTVGLVLAVVAIGLALWWLAGRGSTSDEDGPGADAAEPTPPAWMVRRPPPRRRGAIELPDASAIEDAEAAAGSLAGRVISWLDSSPVAAAELTFAGGGSIHTALTDDEGRFVLRTPRPGAYVLASVLADGFAPYAPEWGQGRLRYTARPGRRIEGVTIELVPRLELEGLVLDADDTPRPGAEIRWLGVGTGETALVAEDDRYTSDARGTFRFVARMGSWLEASHPDGGTGRALVDEQAIALGRLTLHLDPAAGPAWGEIAGRVIDPQGEGVEGARVLGRPQGHGPDVETITDGDGQFVLADLVVGLVRVEARVESFAPVWASGVPTGSDALTLQLAEGGGIEGTIVDHEGAAIAGSTVVALRHTGPLTRVPQAQLTVFDADGAFALRGLPPGVYDVVGGAAGHALARVRGVEVDAALTEVALVLPQGARIEGIVRDASTGSAIAGARVEIERGLSAGPSVAPLRSSALSDEHGGFSLRGVEAGRHSVHAYALGFAPRSLSGIEVEATTTISGLEIGLSPSDEAMGQAFDIVGIGVMVRVQGDALEIVDRVAGGGAEAAGLLPGDQIVAIDGIPVRALLGFGEAVQALRGREGTEVGLEIVRGEADPFEVAVLRSRIRG